MANRKPRVLVIGDLILEEYHHLVDDGQNPEGDGRVYYPHRTDRYLAGAGAVAMLLSSIGAAPVLIAAMETRSNSRIFRQLLGEAGVENGTLEVDGVSLTMRSKCHARGRLLPDVIEQGAAAVLPRARIIERINAIESFAREEGRSRIAAIAIADYGKGAVGPRLVPELQEQFPKLPIVVMPHGGADWKIYRGCDVLLCERSQFESRLAHAVEHPSHLVVVDGRGLSADWKRGWDGAQTLLASGNLDEPVDRAGSLETLLAALTIAQANDREMGASIKAALELAAWQMGQLGIEPLRYEHSRRVCRLALPPSVYGPSPLASAAHAMNAAAAAANLQAESQNLAASAGACISPPENLLAVDDWKIIDLPEAVTHAETDKRHGHKIAVVEGSFETLHAGHLSTLRFAKRQAAVLFVGLKSDDAIARDKGPGRPSTSQQMRARILAALPEVDWIVNFDGDTARLLEALAPDVLVGRDHKAAPEIVR